VQQLVAELGKTPPFLPTGKDVVARGILPGPSVGQALAAARRLWIETGCPVSAEAQLGLLDAAIGNERL
jgi:poly(A) polymerase